MTEKQLRQAQREYDRLMESAGLMTGKRLKKLIASEYVLAKTILDTANPKKGGMAVKSDDIRNRTGD